MLKEIHEKEKQKTEKLAEFEKQLKKVFTDQRKIYQELAANRPKRNSVNESSLQLNL